LRSCLTVCHSGNNQEIGDGCVSSNPQTPSSGDPAPSRSLLGWYHLRTSLPSSCLPAKGLATAGVARRIQRHDRFRLSCWILHFVQDDKQGGSSAAKDPSEYTLLSWETNIPLDWNPVAFGSVTSSSGFPRCDFCRRPDLPEPPVPERRQDGEDDHENEHDDDEFLHDRQQATNPNGAQIRSAYAGKNLRWDGRPCNVHRKDYLSGTAPPALGPSFTNQYPP